MRRTVLAAFFIAVIAAIDISNSVVAQDKAVIQPVETKIGYIPIVDHMLVGLAKITDSDSYEHLDLEPLRFTNYPTMTEALRSGDLDGAFLLAPLAFQLKITGTPIKLVLLGHRDGSGLVVDTQQQIEAVGDLDGRTIAVPHRFSTNNFLLHMHATKNTGAEGGNIDTIEAGPPEMFSALSTGNIDGYITAEPFLSEAEFSGKGKVLFFTSEIWKGHPDCVLILREEFIKENPKAAQELITSLVKTANIVENDRHEAAKLASKFLGKSLKIMKKSLLDRRRVTFYNLIPVPSELEIMQDYMANKMGLFPRTVDMNELIEKKFAVIAYKQLDTQDEK